MHVELWDLKRFTAQCKLFRGSFDAFCDVSDSVSDNGFVFAANPLLFWFSSHMFLWSSISFNLAVLLNLLVAFFYPFSEGAGELDPRLSGLVWTAMLVSLAIVITLPRPSGIRTFIASTILRLIFSVGLEPTLYLLGTLNVLNGIVYLVSRTGGWVSAAACRLTRLCIHEHNCSSDLKMQRKAVEMTLIFVSAKQINRIVLRSLLKLSSFLQVSLMGNRGTFTKSLGGIVTDLEFIYHMGYLVVSMMGMCVHEFFYSLLVSTPTVSLPSVVCAGRMSCCTVAEQREDV